MSDASAALTECTAQRADGTFCGRPSIPQTPFPICFRHAGDILDFMRVVYDQVAVDPADLRRITTLAGVIEHVRYGEPQVQDRTADCVVYYLRVGELIKIGTTGNIARRFAEYPPNAELLAVEPPAATT